MKSIANRKSYINTAREHVNVTTVAKHDGDIVYRRADGLPYVAGPRIGRNDQCPCACGLKAKKCERGLAAVEAGRWS